MASKHPFDEYQVGLKRNAGEAGEINSTEVYVTDDEASC
jgi:hypothetical protein